MHLRFKHDLPCVNVTLTYGQAAIELTEVIIDTGSVSSIFPTDVVERIGILPAPQDRLRNIHGIGGIETVFIRQVDRLQVGNFFLDSFEIDIGTMEYDLSTNGILGID